MEIGKLVIIDFGVARYEGMSLDTEKTGFYPATLAYSAPEQGIKDVDCKIDIYSLGCIIFEVFTGERAFCVDNGGDMDAIKKIYEYGRLKKSNKFNKTAFKKNNMINRNIKKIIKRCLRFNRDERPKSVSEVKNVILDEMVNINLNIHNASDELLKLNA